VITHIPPEYVFCKMNSKAKSSHREVLIRRSAGQTIRRSLVEIPPLVEASPFPSDPPGRVPARCQPRLTVQGQAEGDRPANKREEMADLGC
jgi:hypothetical protein